jgi:hypothetical protein
MRASLARCGEMQVVFEPLCCDTLPYEPAIHIAATNRNTGRRLKVSRPSVLRFAAANAPAA